MKKALLLLIFAFIGIVSYAQKYEITVKIHGLSDTVVYLGHYFGENKMVMDTANIDSNGLAVFTGDRELFKGIYLIVMPSRGMTYFEFLVSDQKKFSLETDTVSFINKLKFTGCKECQVFNNYQKKMASNQLIFSTLNSDYENAKGNDEEQKKVVAQITAQNIKRKKYLEKMIAKNEGTFFSKILLAMKEIEIPEAPKDKDGNQIEADFQYKYYKAHYWDYIDFGENGLLRTPIFQDKVNFYFDKMVVPVADSMIPEARTIIQKSIDKDSLMFQYMASHLLNYFESSSIMGYDAVFCDIAEQWYLNKKAFWADSTFLVKLKNRVIKIGPNIIGHLSSDLKKMQTVDEKYLSLHQINAKYTVLVFYEPNCGHCKKEIPILMQQYRDSLKSMGVKVFAVYTQYDRDEWETFINDKDLTEEGWINVWDGPYPHSGFRDFYDIYSTPVIFVLDENKIIIGKRLGAESIKSLIEYKEKEKQRR